MSAGAAGLQSAAASSPSILNRDHMAFCPRLARDEPHPTAWQFPSFLDDRVRWVRMLRWLYGRAAVFPTSVSAQVGLLLHSLTLNHRPRIAVEIGSFMGVSTIWLAAALRPSARLHAFDPFGPPDRGPLTTELRRFARRHRFRVHLALAGLTSRIRVHPGRSVSQLTAAIHRGDLSPGVDLAFIDGDHTLSGVTADVEALTPILSPGAIVILHDAFPELSGCQGPGRLIERLRAEAPALFDILEIYTAPINYGLAILRRTM